MAQTPSPLWLLAPVLGVLALIAAPPQTSDDDPAAAQGPRVRLRISGNMQGYLEPCGCASGQLGGLARRAFRNGVDRRKLDLRIEGGQLIKGATPLDEFKLMTILEVLSQDNYQAVGVGAHDLVFNDDITAGLFSMVPAISADLTDAKGKPYAVDGQRVFAPYREHKVGPQLVRISSLTLDLPKGATGKRFGLLDPAKAWQQAMQGAPASTIRILIAHADKERLAKLSFAPKPDLVICVSSDRVEPPADAEYLNGIPMVHTGHKGRFLVDVHLSRRDGQPHILRYDQVKLEGSRTAPGAMQSKTAKAVIHSHRELVAADNLLEKMAAQKALPKGQAYIGAQACADCHEEDVETCQKHAHNKAWQTLINAEKKEKWPVTKYPECVSCHVVGYGEKTGFISPKKTPTLLNVSCENCHGPGKLHADSGGEVPIQKRDAGWQVRSCTKCHNAEHSPQFLYEPYWKKIVHGK